jgi:hypothetical protein
VSRRGQIWPTRDWRAVIGRIRPRAYVVRGPKSVFSLSNAWVGTQLGRIYFMSAQFVVFSLSLISSL